MFRSSLNGREVFWQMAGSHRSADIRPRILTPEVQTRK
uniref:Uncharacterized protein n=1 Tax=Anguilla anguilla TaxID=7936 RepID=A0A0E9RQ67_ANGAN